MEGEEEEERLRPVTSTGSRLDVGSQAGRQAGSRERSVHASRRHSSKGEGKSPSFLTYTKSESSSAAILRTVQFNGDVRTYPTAGQWRIHAGLSLRMYVRCSAALRYSWAHVMELRLPSLHG